MLFVVKNGCLPCPYTFYCTEPLAGMPEFAHLPLILNQLETESYPNVTAIN
jgi:hypothetical protein